MNYFFLILKILSFRIKINFRNPQCKNLLVFDCDSIFDLKYILLNYEYFTLQVRKEKITNIYISYQIIKKIFKNYQGNLMSAYLISLIEIVKPKVIITTIDNSLKFFEICKIFHKRIHCLAIQNSSRYDIKLNDYLYKNQLANHELNKKYFIPNFFCFGPYEVNLYKKYKIKIKNFIPIGPLRLSNFLEFIKRKRIKIRKNFYDICLISEACLGKDKYLNNPNMEKGFATVAKYTIMFCIKYNLKFIFASKRLKGSKSHEDEFNFYKIYLNDNEFEYLLKNKIDRSMEKFSSYKTIFESKVIVGTSSTMLREKLCVGEKVLSCNLTKSNLWNFPIGGICAINNCSYKEFEKRLLKVYFMNQDKYRLKIKNKNYLINYNKKTSSIKKIKKYIDLLIN